MKIIKTQTELNVSKACELLDIPRSSVYYKSCSKSNDTILMNEIHELWLKYPFYGYRRITAVLNRNGHCINRKRVYRLMSEMQLKAIYPKKTTFCNKDHAKYPYLLKDLRIDRPDQVWATDITYIKMSKGFVYLVALIDVHSRYVVAWELSTSLDIEFCMAMADSALAKKQPEIINTDQGSQFTSSAWIEKMLRHNIKISMDSKGRCLDNVYIERFWRSLKQEEIYLKPYDSVEEARAGIAKYIEFYNYQRPHQSLNYKVPAELYFVGSAHVCPCYPQGPQPWWLAS